MEDILYLTHRMPYPPNRGSNIRAFHLLKYLSQHFRVHLGCLVDDADDWHHIEQVRSLCVDSCFVGQTPAIARVRSVGALLTGQPMSLPYYYSGRLQRWVTRTLGARAIERALAFSGPMAQYLSGNPGRTLQRIVDFADVESAKWQVRAGAESWPLSLLYRREAQRLLNYECAIAQRFDAATFVSRSESDLFCQRAPETGHKVDFFNNGVDSDHFSPAAVYRNPYPDGATVLVFTGAMDYLPNVEAACWFANAVLPALRSGFPELCFYIVGPRPGAQVKALVGRRGVVVTGAVPDVRPYLAHAVLAVAPIRSPSGVQGKVLEAMAMQKTVVCSPQALEGIHAEPGVDLLVAHDGDQFIAHITEMLRGKANRSLGIAARKRILRDYSWDSNLQRLGHLLGVGQPTCTTPPLPPVVATAHRDLRHASVVW